MGKSVPTYFGGNHFPVEEEDQLTLFSVVVVPTSLTLSLLTSFFFVSFIEQSDPWLLMRPQPSIHPCQIKISIMILMRGTTSISETEGAEERESERGGGEEEGRRRQKS